MLTRWVTNPKRPGGAMPAVAKVFEMISTATVAKSAQEAQELLFLRPADKITMNRNRLLADTKARALAMVEGIKLPHLLNSIFRVKPLKWRCKWRLLTSVKWVKPPRTMKWYLCN